MLIYDAIKKGMKGVIKRDAMLKDYTYISIGGPVDILTIPEGVEDFKWLMTFIRKEGFRYFILGNGTNLIFSDKGFRGIVVKMNRCFQGMKVYDKEIFAGSGVDLSKLILTSAEDALSGLELLSGIPGTVGGAIWMNAGAFGREIKDCVKSVHYMNKNGEEKEGEIEFSYRKSPFRKGDIITGALFGFEKRDKRQIMEEIERIKRKRMEKQPLEFASAGSVFKNPSNSSAGEIIDRLGMKGMRIGDAELSTKHANFIINRGNATSNDVKSIVEKIKEKVRKEEGIELELEVEFVEEK